MIDARMRAIPRRPASRQRVPQREVGFKMPASHASLAHITYMSCPWSTKRGEDSNPEGVV
ncbi:hypothetical protein ColKHC_08095 [Colletotrichum higginsianum]|nr:hypothetical protein ColKHC_08095 [Colletotrichum higginsianum]